MHHNSVESGVQIPLPELGVDIAKESAVHEHLHCGMMNWCIEQNRDVRANAPVFVRKFEGRRRGNLGDFKFIHSVGVSSWAPGYGENTSVVWAGKIPTRE